jgi:hypothetical protein
VEARSGPGEDFLGLFDLFAAAEFRVLERQGGWVRALLPDGRQGWLPEDAIARI